MFEDAIKLIEADIRWHEYAMPTEKQYYAKGFLAGLQQARGLLIAASMGDPIVRTKKREAS